MPGVVSAQSAPQRMRSKGRSSISMRGMPKLVWLDDWSSLKEKRVALKRASLTIEDESVRTHVAMPKRLLGAVLMSPIGRLRPAASGPVPRKREMYELMVSTSLSVRLKSRRGLYWL